MEAFPRGKDIYIICGFVDQRIGLDGLKKFIETTCGMKLDDRSIFMCCGTNPSRCKIILKSPPGIECREEIFHGIQMPWPRNPNTIYQVKPMAVARLMSGLPVGEENILWTIEYKD